MLVPPHRERAGPGWLAVCVFVCTDGQGQAIAIIIGSSCDKISSNNIYIISHMYHGGCGQLLNPINGGRVGWHADRGKSRGQNGADRKPLDKSWKFSVCAADTEEQQTRWVCVSIGTAVYARARCSSSICFGSAPTTSGAETVAYGSGTEPNIAHICDGLCGRAEWQLAGGMRWLADDHGGG